MPSRRGSKSKTWRADRADDNREQVCEGDVRAARFSSRSVHKDRAGNCGKGLNFVRAFSWSKSGSAYPIVFPRYFLNAFH